MVAVKNGQRSRYTQNICIYNLNKQTSNNILFDTLVSTTSLESSTKGYVLHCRAESKSPVTISGYEMILKNFAWYCNQYNYNNVQTYTGEHIRRFLSYLSQESNRWGSNCIAANKFIPLHFVHPQFTYIRSNILLSRYPDSIML